MTIVGLGTYAVMHLPGKAEGPREQRTSVSHFNAKFLQVGNSQFLAPRRTLGRSLSPALPVFLVRCCDRCLTAWTQEKTLANAYLSNVQQPSAAARLLAQHMVKAVRRTADVLAGEYLSNPVCSCSEGAKTYICGMPVQEETKGRAPYRCKRGTTAERSPPTVSNGASSVGNNLWAAC